MTSNAILPVILCGGSGSRLWPLSRSSYPKQFLSLNFTENRSLLQKTQLRTKGISNIQDPILICNEEHRFIVAEQMREINVKPNSILLEPCGRNTGPAITIAALKALEIYEDPNILVLASDHQIEDEIIFLDVIQNGLEYSSKGKLVTFGIVPTSPEIGYGYIKSKIPLSKTVKASSVDCFIEKPDKDKAMKLIKDNRFTWNSGIFLFKARNILKELEYFEPDMLKYCKLSLQKSLFDLDFQRLEIKSFAKCPDISIDIAVMEKTKNAYVLSLDAGWSDVGSWDSIWSMSKKNSEGNVIQGNIITEDTKNSFLLSQKRLITAIGLENIIVVETNDAILIAKKDESQKVKDMVKFLKDNNKTEGFEHQKCYRPWGTFESLVKENRWQVKLISVKPGGKLSLQSHKFRSEHWVVVSGTAKVELDGGEMILNANESSYIPLGIKHRLSNPGNDELKIIEVQSGSYLGEDDIERFEDSYGRIGEIK
tara:strand:+ start:890 stop:2335 length:1446 start_codon:yes stop_codon:yes gene_type:complete